MFEEEIIGDRLSEELRWEPAAPPLGNLVAAATADGERMRRTRRIGQVVAGMAGVTAVAAGAVGLSSGIGQPGNASAASAASGGNGGAIATAPVGNATPTASASTPGEKPLTSGTAPAEKPSGSVTWSTLPNGKAAPGPGVTPTANWRPAPSWMTVPQAAATGGHQTPATAQSMVKLLEDLIAQQGTGGGSFLHPVGASMLEGHGTGTANVYWNNSSVRILVAPKGGLGADVCYPTAVGQKPGPCTNYKLADGTTVTVYTEEPFVGASGSDIKLSKTIEHVTVTRTDGTQIAMLLFNGPQSAQSGPARADMSLTDQQLYAIASDPRWGATMDSAYVEQAKSLQLQQDVF